MDGCARRAVTVSRGTCTIFACFQSAGGVLPLILVKVVHIPGLSQHFVSLRLVSYAGHEYSGEVNSITITLTTAAIVFGPSVGKLDYLNALRSGPHAD